MSAPGWYNCAMLNLLTLPWFELECLNNSGSVAAL